MAADPVGEVQRLGVTVRWASTADACGLHASYDRDTDTITLDLSASDARTRFSCLHELGHREVDSDDEINDWLWDLGPDGSRRTLEELCDAFAAEILLPLEDCRARLRPGFGAREVLDLMGEATASREACVVRAAQLLHEPGIVVLAGPDAVVQFSSCRSLRFRVGRGVPQRADSVIGRAAAQEYASTAGDSLQLATGTSFELFRGDARSRQGVIVAVLRRVDPDEEREPKAVTCPKCDDVLDDPDWCPTCRRPVCPTHGCGCPPTRTPERRVCSKHHMVIPIGADVCSWCADEE